MEKNSASNQVVAWWFALDKMRCHLCTNRDNVLTENRLMIISLVKVFAYLVINTSSTLLLKPD